jgi:hypothetical protein
VPDVEIGAEDKDFGEWGQRSGLGAQADSGASGDGEAVAVQVRYFARGAGRELSVRRSGGRVAEQQSAGLECDLAGDDRLCVDRRAVAARRYDVRETPADQHERTDQAEQELSHRFTSQGLNAAAARVTRSSAAVVAIRAG